MALGHVMASGAMPDEIPEGIHALVVPGVFEGESQEVYPEGTVALVKRMRQQGLSIAYATSDRHKEIALYSVDWVLPILVFTAEGIANGVLDVFVHEIWDRIKGVPGAGISEATEASLPRPSLGPLSRLAAGAAQ